MKLNWLVNALLYMLGLWFNLALLVLAGYAVYVYAIQGFLLGSNYANQVTAEKPSMEIEFVLDEDTSAAEVAQRLEELGIIENQYLYRLELFLKNSSKVYKAGTYALNQNMSNTQVNVTLREQPKKEVVNEIIRIPEGYNIRDIATYLEGREFFEASQFIEACETGDFPYSFLNDIPDRPNRLEGYLFPDTYFVSEHPTPHEIIHKMLARFDEIYSDEYRERAEELGLSMDDIVTAASIIEKEVRVPAERPLVSQVIHNRLKINMPLQMCSTVLYVLDKKRDRLLLSDLDVNSPYNTYIYGGLPKGPIASPGADCIRAALYPAEGRYLFFVLMDEDTGRHFFTHDHNEHVNAKNRYGQDF